MARICRDNSYIYEPIKPPNVIQMAERNVKSRCHFVVYYQKSGDTPDPTGSTPPPSPRLSIRGHVDCLSNLKYGLGTCWTLAHVGGLCVQLIPTLNKNRAVTFRYNLPFLVHDFNVPIDDSSVRLACRL